MDLRDLYDQYATKHSGHKRLEDEALVAKRDVLPHMPSPRAVSVLDVGCGQGGLVKALADQGYADTHGVDINDEQVSNGVRNVACGDYRDLLRSRTWDCVVATDLLEHLAKDEVMEPSSGRNR